mmetsp:Transcript_10873/g.19907  ORF Transcript_10873/g.19907 Transcript_10873/m.19907 type:complete len:208 (-) Transcript_10873:700-1323(-)
MVCFRGASGVMEAVVHEGNHVADDVRGHGFLGQQRVSAQQVQVQRAPRVLLLGAFAVLHLRSKLLAHVAVIPPRATDVHGQDHTGNLPHAAPHLADIERENAAGVHPQRSDGELSVCVLCVPAAITQAVSPHRVAPCPARPERPQQGAVASRNDVHDPFFHIRTRAPLYVSRGWVRGGVLDGFAAWRWVLLHSQGDHRQPSRSHLQD